MRTDYYSKGFVLFLSRIVAAPHLNVYEIGGLLELFDNRVSNAFGYAVIFFLLPFFVVGMVALVGKL